MITPTTSCWAIPQRLASYALAFWAFETVEAAIQAIVIATPPEGLVATYTAPNFSLFRQWACPPDRLPEYDRQYGLAVTEVT